MNAPLSIDAGEGEPWLPIAPTSYKRASALQGKSVPAREWAVPGWIPCRTVTQFGGDGGTGKSLAALQLCTASARGAGWLGLAVREGSAIYFSAEDDDDEMERRIDDIARAEGFDKGELQGLTYKCRAGENALLASVEPKTGNLRETALFRELAQQVADEQPSVVIVDTLADVFPGNENDRRQVNQFMGLLKGLAIRNRCAVILLAHPSLSGLNSGSGTSGSTAWNNSARARVYLSRVVGADGAQPNPDARTLQNMKANYGRTGGEIGLTWQSGILVANAIETGLDRIAGGAKAERVFMKLLRQYAAEGRYVLDVGPTSAPKTFAEHPDAEGCRKAVLKAAMDSLFAKHQITIGEHGSGVKTRRHIAEVHPHE